MFHYLSVFIINILLEITWFVATLVSERRVSETTRTRLRNILSSLRFYCLEHTGYENKPVFSIFPDQCNYIDKILQIWA